MSWTDGPLLGFDTETTGVNPRQARLVTAALVHVDNAECQGMRGRQWLADPGVEIPAGAQAVHGISTEYARQNGRPVAQVVDEVAEQLALAARTGTPVVIFNANYDLPLLEAEARRHGVPGVYERLGETPLHVIDPLVLDRHYDRYRRGKRTLGVLADLFDIRVQGDLHDARTDVVTTLRLVGAFAAKYPQMARVDLAQLHRLQRQANADWARGFNKWLASRGRTPDACEDWPLGR